ncbi:MAG TPA: hypothetical protein VKS20_03040 [Candidatus Acidoferrales bacterium]|nr:hypothetical protein [Candidatus Acidoferrales bacterium]
MASRLVNLRRIIRRGNGVSENGLRVLEKGRNLAIRNGIALRVGSSSEADVERLAKVYGQYLTSREDEGNGFRIRFTVSNTWLSTLRLEPPAWFGAAVNVKSGRVYHIGAWLMRSMDIFPTFQATAGDVDEYAEYPGYMSDMHSADYGFPTPIGKPYLRVLLDSHASPLDRQHAFDFSFRCLIKPGGGCDLPCDYLPSAWQDWEAELRTDGYVDLFNKAYPKNSRCRP